MLEVIKIIMEILAKNLDITHLSSMRQQRQLNEVGSELFLLYIRLNETIVSGEEILSILETYLTRMEGHLLRGDDAYGLQAGKWLETTVAQQLLNLARLAKCIERLSREMQILDGETYRRLRPLVQRKTGILAIIIQALREDQLPVLGFTDQELLELTDRAGGDDIEAQKALHSQLRTIADRSSEMSIPLSHVWDEEVYEKVRDYMTSYSPRKQLEELTELVDRFRSSLEETFTLKDVLIRIGDKRLGDHDMPYW